MTVQDQFYQAATDIIPQEERKKFGLFTLDDMHALREAERKMVFDAVKEHMHQLHLSPAVESEVLSGVDKFREEPVPEFSEDETTTVSGVDPLLTVSSGSGRRISPLPRRRTSRTKILPVSK